MQFKVPFAETEGGGGAGGIRCRAGASGGEGRGKLPEAREMRGTEAAATTSGGPRFGGSADEARTWQGCAAPCTLEL